MTPEEAKLVRHWFECWRLATPVLEQVRAEDIRRTDTVRAMQLLDEAFDAALRQSSPRPASGLVELQAIFAKARAKME